MPKCKAIHYLAVVSIAFAQGAAAQSIPYKQYMAQKRFPNLAAQNYQSPDIYEPAAAPQYQPAPQVLPVQQPQYTQATQYMPVPQYQPQQNYLAPAQTVVSSYARSQAAQEYAMRPPAPYADTAVPQAQADDIRRRPSMQPSDVQPMQQQLPPQYQPQQQYYQHQITPRVEMPKKEDEGKILGGDITGSMAVTSDYVFRGLSQSKEGPAIQGGVEYQHEVGAYIGMWASNVDFNDGDEAQVELDGYVGYRTAITDDLSADVGAIYYGYPGADSNLDYDYWEFYAAAEYGIPLGMKTGAGFDVDKATIGASFSYSPEFFAKSGSAYYAKATAGVPFANGITIDGHLGKQWIEDNNTFLLPDYMDWSLGIAYALPKQFEVKLQYVDTNLDEKDCADGCDAKAVATLSKSF